MDRVEFKQSINHENTPAVQKRKHNDDEQNVRKKMKTEPHTLEECIAIEFSKLPPDPPDSLLNELEYRVRTLNLIYSFMECPCML
jgi:hypothetical protein